MLYKNVEFFNVEEMEHTPDGTILYRFPKETTMKMGEIQYHKRISRLTTGIELRFVGEAFITFQVLDWEGFIEVFAGDYQVSKYYARKNERVTIETSYSSLNNREDMKPGRYSPELWRICIGHDIRVRLVDIEPFGELRPPRPDEVPSTKMLAYGSSITHGAGSVIASQSYIQLLARKLGIDVLNKGMGGSCMCESAVGDYIAKADADLFFLELGINMVTIHPAEVFYERASYIIKKAVSTGKKVIFVSPYYNRAHSGIDKNLYDKIMAYEDVCERLASENDVFFVKGREILPDSVGLTTDMAHPSMMGSAMMADNLYDKLKDII